MDTIFSRYRNLTILAVVLFAQVLVLAVQVKVPYERKPVRLARVWALSLVTPFEKGVVHAQQGVTDLWQNYVWLRGVRSENDALRDENERLRLEQIRLVQDAAQARRLQALLQFKEQTVSETVAAQVIGSSGSETSRTVTIDKGIADGIKADDAVITPDGVVGKILRVFNEPTMRHTAQVLLVTDPSSGVGGILESSRLQGILRGTQAGELLLQYVMSDEKVQVGENVLTSGGDRIFPKGMPFGKVTQVSSGPDLFLNIRVRPSAQISRLEEVLVITKIVEKEPDATAAASGPIRAADVLAQRLPTIVAQPPAAEGENRHAEPPSFTEWLRQQKAAQAAAKQGGAASPPAKNAVPKTGGTPTSSGANAPKSATPTAKPSSVTGQSGSASTNPPNAAPSAPKKAAPKKQPDTTAPQKPASPPDQSPATPPGVTL